MNNRIEKSIELKASVDRVWKALSDSKEFGQWFKATFEGPFEVGRVVVARMTMPGFEHHRFQVDVKALEAPHRFAFEWRSVPAQVSDQPSDAPTMVEFTVAARGTGSVVTVVETGFERLPLDKRLEAYRDNDEGWGIQLGNLAAYVA